MYNSKIANMNNISLIEADKLKRKNLSEKEKFLKHNILKHNFPFFGNIDFQIPNYPEKLCLFSANDDVCGWEIFWLGEYESKTSQLFYRLAQKDKKTFYDIQ